MKHLFRQAIISKACSLLIQIGFDAEMFNLKKIHEHGYTDEVLFKLIEPLHLFTDLDELTYITRPIPKNDFVKFVDRMKWLGTKEGMHAISDSLTRLSKKNLQLSEEYVALAHKLVRYTAPDRLNRKTILDEINELEKLMSQRKKEYFEVDENLKIKLGALYEYKDPSIQELQIETHKLYSDACISEGRSVIPIYREEGFERPIKEFGDVVKKNHLLRFLNNPNRQEKIEKYFKERLQWYDYVVVVDPQDSGESSKTIVSDTDESEAEVSDEHVSKKTRKRALTDEATDDYVCNALLLIFNILLIYCIFSVLLFDL